MKDELEQGEYHKISVWCSQKPRGRSMSEVQGWKQWGHRVGWSWGIMEARQWRDRWTVKEMAYKKINMTCWTRATWGLDVALSGPMKSNLHMHEDGQGWDM